MRAAAALALMALPAAAQAPSTERAALLIELIRENGCEMTGEEVGEILPRHDFSKDETQAITTELFRKGEVRVERETDTLILLTESCR